MPEPKINRVVQLADGYTSEVNGTLSEIVVELVERREEVAMTDAQIQSVREFCRGYIDEHDNLVRDHGIGKAGISEVEKMLQLLDGEGF